MTHQKLIRVLRNQVARKYSDLQRLADVLEAQKLEREEVNCRAYTGYDPDETRQRLGEFVAVFSAAADFVKAVEAAYLNICEEKNIEHVLEPIAGHVANVLHDDLFLNFTTAEVENETVQILLEKKLIL